MTELTPEQIAEADRVYTIAIRCQNCGYGKSDGHDDKWSDPPHYLDIVKGTTIQQELHNKRCPNCGCAELVQR